jgi:CRISPR system Cascade subunit CasA
MNLITEPWIPVIRLDNSQDMIAPWQIAETDNSVIEIRAPRPDFQGALYQFLIGLLQTAFAPEDEDEWLEFWQETPVPSVLQKHLEKLAFAFELENPSGPAFLQDLDLTDGESNLIDALLIDAPSANALEKNLDHFNKRDTFKQLCPSCTASALFTLQTNAPEGGRGYRVGIRGGGPLTTLIIPKVKSSTLWQKLWLNILPKDDLGTAQNFDAKIFPWLDTTRVSDKNQATTPSDVHPLQAYWGMPRRIRLSTKILNSNCDLCGNPAQELFSSYETKNYGVYYYGAWLHPLTPYKIDPKNINLPLSLKGEQGCLGYKNWLGLTLQDNNSGTNAASIIQFYNQERSRSQTIRGNAALWCFGYDMAQMKARCWYESRFPIYYLSETQQTNLMDWASELVIVANEAIRCLRDAVKEARLRNPKEVKGNLSKISQFSQIDFQFWQATEVKFYVLLEKLAALPDNQRLIPNEIYSDWYSTISQQLFTIFETATLAAPAEDLDLKRIINARNSLRQKFFGNKTIKILKDKVQPKEVVYCWQY